MDLAASLTIGKREFAWGTRTFVMGIINVTPDSFSGDGVGTDAEAAVAQGLRFTAEGADILDVGGESTRPGFEGISAEEEMRRVLPVIERLSRQVDTPVSIDTAKAEVAAAALEAGAVMLNDVWGLRRDPDIAGVAARFGVPAVVMHNQRGRPFRDVIGDVKEGLEASIALATAAGVPRERLIVDPGFGFGWKEEHNLEMLRRLGELRALGLPILVGTSRKSTIGAVLGLPVEERLFGTAASVALAIANGADIVRVHDVKEMMQVRRVADAVVRGWRRPEEKVV
ncbi:MAG TPA: dihydropteroate synthase [Dehalococcoidia bacterium]|nr:dihydropteroate synthase [Dehalococcoidia bacterium]